MPCSTPSLPGAERRRVAAGLDAVARGLDADQSARSSCVDEGANMPIAFEPPPTHATTASGRRPDLLRGSAAWPRRRSRAGTRARSPDTDAGRRRCRRSSRCVATLVTQSRIASFMASLSVRLPDCTGVTLAPSRLHARARSAPGARTSSAPMNTSHCELEQRRTRWRWRRRAGRRRSRRSRAACPCACASRTWPSALFILCAPVWHRSSRLSQTENADRRSDRRSAKYSGVGRPT